MTPRQRIERALSHQEVDRVPIDLGGTHNSTIGAGAYRRLAAALGVSVPARLLSRAFDIVQMDEAVLARLPVDTRGVFARPPGGSPARWLDDDTFLDEWGITLRRAPGAQQYDIVGHPLAQATINDLENYPWPDVEDPARYAGVAEAARLLHENTPYAVCGAAMDTVIFDRAWQLRGMAQFLQDLLLDLPFALALLDRVAALQYRRHERFLAEAGRWLDVVVIADDMGTQRGPLIRPALYREVVKPFHRRYVETIRRHTGAAILMHACGSIFDLVEDYIEIGIAAVNPMQVTARRMDPANLRAHFAGRMAFWGGIDTQQLLPLGSEQEVRAGVDRMLATMGCGGGYVLAAVHNIQDDVPPANILAMLDQAARAG